MLTNSRDAYGWVAIFLHWVMALAIIALFALGLWMTTLEYYDAWYHRAPDIHKSVGMLTLFLLFFRLAWAAFNTKPVIHGATWERVVALIVHRAHYVLMLGVMITGYLIPTAKGAGVSVFGWFTVPSLLHFTERQGDVVGLIHWGLAWALIGLAVLHSAAALKHHFIDRDETLTRMLGIKRIQHQGTRTQSKISCA